MITGLKIIAFIVTQRCKFMYFQYTPFKLALKYRSRLLLIFTIIFYSLDFVDNKCVGLYLCS